MILDNNLLIAVVGAIIGAGVSQFLNRNREKTALAFDMHRELNNSEMSKCRQNALDFIKRNPKISYKDLSAIDKDGAISVFILLRFFQRLSQAIKYNQVKKSLIVGLFSEIFYYWYYMSYEKNLLDLNWEAAEQIRYLDKWFKRKMDESEINKLNLKVKEYYKEVLKS